MKKQAKIHTDYVAEEWGDLQDLELGGGTLMDDNEDEITAGVDTDQTIRNMIEQVEENITSLEQTLYELAVNGENDLEAYTNKLKYGKPVTPKAAVSGEGVQRKS